MLYPNDDGRHPSLLVEDGETVTIGLRDAREIGMPVFTVRPRTTVAMMVLGGRALAQAPRLNDRGAFEQVESANGLLSFTDLDSNGTIGGYSVPFIAGILDALDPREPRPSTSVHLAAHGNGNGRANDCGCGGSHVSGEATGRAFDEIAGRERTAMKGSATAVSTGRSLEAYVPEFLVNLQIYSLFVRLGDIVIGRSATLILDDDLSFIIADNVLAYTGSRIVQRADYVNLDVVGIMRGGILTKFHTLAEAKLRVDFANLALQPSTKP